MLFTQPSLLVYSYVCKKSINESKKSWYGKKKNAYIGKNYTIPNKIRELIMNRKGFNKNKYIPIKKKDKLSKVNYNL